MNWIAWTILAFLLADFLLHRLSGWLNLKAISDTIPDSFRGVFDPDKYRLSQSYLATQTRFGAVTATVDLLVLLVFWFGGGFSMLDAWTRSLGGGPLATGLIYVGILAGLKVLLHQPFSFYATFVIEERFGFNTTTPAIWAKDRLKGLLLALVMGVPLLAGVLAVFNYAGDWAWIWCWALVTVFTIVIQFIAPTWIMPLFNRFDPLDDGALKEAILAYARAIGFKLKDIAVMDGSRRSAKTNAFFTGFGRSRRIVLFDTLIAGHTIDELVAVLAHEMGHYKLRHIPKMMLAGILQTGMLFYLMSLVIHTPALYAAFHVAQPSIHAGLIFFGMLFAPLEFFLGLLVRRLSRMHEYAADRFAASTTGHPRSMVDALKKLSVHNLSNLTPHPLHVFLNYSHPPVLQRIAAIEKIGDKTHAVTGVKGFSANVKVKTPQA